MFKLTEAIDIVNNGIDVFFAKAGCDSAIDACFGIILFFHLLHNFIDSRLRKTRTKQKLYLYA